MQRWIIVVLALAPTSSMACNTLIGLDAPSSEAGDGGVLGDGGGVSRDGPTNDDSMVQDGASCAIAATFTAPPRTAGSTAPAFSRVALVRDGVYALTAGPGLFGNPMQLFRGASCDGSLTLAHDATLLSALATDATAVYVATATSIESYPIDTTQGTTAELVETLIDPSTAFALVSNGDDMFYATAVDGSMSSALTRHPLSSPMAGSGIFWTSPDALQITGLAADKNGLYLTGSGGGGLLSISRQTSQSHVLVPGVASNAPFMVAGAYVYWTTSDATFGTLRRARTSDGVAEDVVPPLVSAFAVIDDDVYVWKYSQILHMKIGSTSSDVIGQDTQGGVLGMVADATRVCWWSASTITVIAR